MKQRVAIYKCAEYNLERVEQGIVDIFAHFGGIEQFVKPGQRVLIKPNLLAADPLSKPTCTHPVVIEAVIRQVQQAGGIAFVGDNPTTSSVNRVAYTLGLDNIAGKYGAKIISFGKNTRHKEAHDERYGFLYTAEVAREFDVILNVAKLKAHSQLMLTLGVKNMFGFVSLARRVRKHAISKGDVDGFARMLLKVYQVTNPSFTLVDGIIAMEKKGPRGGEAKNVGLLFGGESGVSVDRVIAEVLCLPYTDLPVLRAAQKLGIDGWDINRIEVCGEAIEEVTVTDFKFPELLPISFEIYRSVKILAREIYNAFTGRMRPKK